MMSTFLYWKGILRKVIHFTIVGDKALGLATTRPIYDALDFLDICIMTTVFLNGRGNTDT
jgi:hypothetical protein